MLCQACVLCSPPEPVKAREDIFVCWAVKCTQDTFLFAMMRLKDGFFSARVHPMYTQILIIGMRLKRQNADL